MEMSYQTLISKQQFMQLARQGYSHVPVISRIPADLDTPLSAYLKLANVPYSYLLESVQGGEKWGRYSIIGLGCRQLIEVRGQQIEVRQQQAQGWQVISTEQHADPLAWLERYQQQFYIPQIWADNQDLPRFLGGLVGYFGYETIAYIEPRLDILHKHDELNSADILLMQSDELVVFDNLSGVMYLIVHAHIDAQKPQHLWQQARARLTQLLQQLSQPPRPEPADSRQTHAPTHIREQDFVSGFSHDKFLQAVERIKQYITDGDAMQVVLSQRMSIDFDAPPLYLYRALRSINPSPYMYYLNFDDFQIIGASPEILTRVEGRQLTVRPIAGTRPRGRNEQQDRQLEQELLADPKERAEHLMLIDLGRNDVGRVAKTGTVQVTDKMIIERYSHVMHIVSNVTAELADDKTLMDALRATFPAGTVSGAPKIRAMEIIDELEPVKRGVYSGAVGYYSWSGNLDTAIAIRTALIKNRKLYIQAGAGIVADSIAENEWQETLNKGRSIFRAVMMAQQGFDIQQYARDQGA